MNQYSEDLKKAMVAKLCSPGGLGYSQLALESGIAPSTLHGWVKKYGGDSKVKSKRRPQDWNAVERLQAVFEAQKLNDYELGEFLRRHGLHSHTIEEWKAEAIAAIAEKASRGRPKKDPELVEKDEKIKHLQRDLRRKDKALAEATALIILKKRAEEIWGKDEDDE